MENILEINGLCKTYRDFSLKNVTFALPKGYIMGFVGQNGSGKTTTVRSIMNMTKFESGSISVFGLDSVKDTIEIKQRLGVVFYSMYLAEHLTARQIDQQIRPFYTKWDSDDFFAYLKRFGLPDDRCVGDFSKGMKMKLMVTIALAHKPELLILDEPTSGLDPVARDELLDILSDYILDENRGILFSTHITADVERIADYVTILNNGSVWFTAIGISQMICMAVCGAASFAAVLGLLTEKRGICRYVISVLCNSAVISAIVCFEMSKFS